MAALLRAVAALVAILTLYAVRAWLVLFGAFFGVVLWRGAYGLARDGERFEAGFMAVMGSWLLFVSYRWFALRWRGGPPPEAPPR